MQVLIHSSSDLLKSKVQPFTGRGISIKFRGVSRIHEFYNEIDIAVLDFDSPDIDWFGKLNEFDLFSCKPKIIVYSNNPQDKMCLSHKCVYSYVNDFSSLLRDAVLLSRGTPKTSNLCRKCRKK